MAWCSAKKAQGQLYLYLYVIRKFFHGETEDLSPCRKMLDHLLKHNNYNTIIVINQSKAEVSPWGWSPS
jgi:hypothetical protein